MKPGDAEDMNDLLSKMRIMRAAVNVFRMMKPLSDLAPSEEDRVDYSMEMVRGYRELAKISFVRDKKGGSMYVQKEIAEPSTFFPGRRRRQTPSLSGISGLSSYSEINRSK